MKKLLNHQTSWKIMQILMRSAYISCFNIYGFFFSSLYIYIYWNKLKTEYCAALDNTINYNLHSPEAIKDHIPLVIICHKPWPLTHRLELHLDDQQHILRCKFMALCHSSSFMRAFWSKWQKLGLNYIDHRLRLSYDRINQCYCRPPH